MFVVAKGLVGAMREAAGAHEEVIGLLEYSLAISRCVIDAACCRVLPPAVQEIVKDLMAEMEAVTRFAYNSHTQTGCRFWKLISRASNRETAAEHKAKLRKMLRLMVASLVVCPHWVSEDAKVPHGAPTLPQTYVRRPVSELVVEDLTNVQRQASKAHCLWGMGGSGKSLMASSVVRDSRTLSIFKQGIFWLPVGAVEKDNVAMALGQLAQQLAGTAAGKGFQYSGGLNCAEDVIRHLKRVTRTRRCLVVLDNVWDVEVVNAFVGTGFHLLITTRDRSVVSRCCSGEYTQVGDMTEEEALCLLKRASGAAGPLPEVEAKLVRVARRVVHVYHETASAMAWGNCVLVLQNIDRGDCEVCFATCRPRG